MNYFSIFGPVWDGFGAVFAFSPLSEISETSFFEGVPLVLTAAEIGQELGGN